ncbi:hypothetical protein THOM_2632 [Trachipleistophora hominis]|uniref:Uncharacterized protein n=1 Tax=Trachipleistophora hominis TaxID=72359 RepID=L7JSJ1_TRAHO|nr:hypothetical protein THOM_2632 [Trachipleistophora hominis]
MFTLPMILVIDVYDVPAAKIIQFIYDTKMFREIEQRNDASDDESNAIFQYLNKMRTREPTNFFVRGESFSKRVLDKIKYYFDEICEVQGTILRITDRKKREIRFYDIVRDEREIINFVRIKDDLREQADELGTSRTIKPYLDAQEDEVVLFPSDEE